MAPKRDNPPASSSDEAETTSSGEEGDGEEVESSSEDEQEQKTKERASSPPQLTQPGIKKPASTIKKVQPKSESESGTESDSESEDLAPLNVKPISSKPMEETPPKSSKNKSKTSASTVALGKCSSKRGSEVERDAKDSKRSKTKDLESNGASEKGEDTKKLLFQRLWSEDDEVALLKGIMDFIEKKGIDPAKDMNAFYDYIKNSLHFDVALSQLKDKVWRLKKKFENHTSKGAKGEDKKFSKPHDQNLFDLSKKIWGSGGICGKSKSLAPPKNDSVIRVEGEKANKMETEVENHVGTKVAVELDRGVGVGLSSMEDYVIKRGLDMVDEVKKSEMEEKWRKLHVAELELFLKRNQLISEQAKLMLASYKSA
ncbi:DNA-binding storekeeper protein-related transcriptional regulator [Euphorbia peplus]|nr:DNA-binding storekeeper protein-related transcriptional regulator [Euphorbia peplus]